MDIPTGAEADAMGSDDVVSGGHRRLHQLLQGPAGEFGVLAGTAVVTVGGALAFAGDPTARPIWPGGIGLLAVAVAALAWRRRHPVPVLAVTAIAAMAYYLLDFPSGFEPLPFVIALYGASGHGFRAVSLVAAASATALVAAVQLVTEPRMDPTEVLAVLGWLLLVIVVAEVVRARREYVVAVEQRAAEAERGREAEAARRVVEERLRIARELHDALAHHISVISVQAGAAILRRDARPELAHELMPTIKQAAADAMRELRATLGVLRDRGDAPLAPRPGLDDLATLVRGYATAGPEVTTTVTGARRRAAPEVDLTAYRIVQEALTNSTRHADARRVQVLLHYGTEELEIRVDDDGTGAGPTDPGSGLGLAGLAERTAAAGGTLRAGPGADGGFRVHARLPLDPS
jgi:signal transduction histidine kinase